MYRAEMKKVCQKLGSDYVLNNYNGVISYTIDSNYTVRINKNNPNAKRFTISLCNGENIERQIHNIPFVRIKDWVEEYKYI
jgi:hypothetical protein